MKTCVSIISASIACFAQAAAQSGTYHALEDTGQFRYEVTSENLNVFLPVEFVFVNGSSRFAPGYGLREYEWSRRHPDERADFQETFQGQVQRIWSNKYLIEGRSGNNNTLVRTLKVNVFVVPVDKDPLWKVVVEKYPQDFTGYDIATICYPGQSVLFWQDYCEKNSQNDKFGGLNLGSSLQFQHDQHELNLEYISFNKSSSKIANEAEAVKKLDKFLKLLTSPSDDWKVTVTGVATIPEIPPRTVNYPEEKSRPGILLARARVEETKRLLMKQGVAEDKIVLVADNPYLNKIDDESGYVQIGLAKTMQSTLAHEAGHFFGLLDEYEVTEGDCGKPLSSPEFNELLLKWGFEPVLHCGFSSIMARGNKVLPHHYVFFLDLLGENLPQLNWTLQTLN